MNPKTIGDQNILFLQEGAEKGSIDVDWKNNITITFIDQNEVAHIFKLTNKGFWKQQFEFSNLKRGNCNCFNSSKHMEKMDKWSCN